MPVGGAACGGLGACGRHRGRCATARAESAKGSIRIRDDAASLSRQRRSQCLRRRLQRMDRRRRLFRRRCRRTDAGVPEASWRAQAPDLLPFARRRRGGRDGHRPLAAGARVDGRSRYDNSARLRVGRRPVAGVPRSEAVEPGGRGGVAPERRLQLRLRLCGDRRQGPSCTAGRAARSPCRQDHDLSQIFRRPCAAGDGETGLSVAQKQSRRVRRDVAALPPRDGHRRQVFRDVGEGAARKHLLSQPRRSRRLRHRSSRVCGDALVHCPIAQQQRSPQQMARRNSRARAQGLSRELGIFLMLAGAAFHDRVFARTRKRRDWAARDCHFFHRQP